MTTDIDKACNKLDRQIFKLQAALQVAIAKIGKEPGLTPEEQARNKRFLNSIRANVAELVRKKQGLRGRAS